MGAPAHAARLCSVRPWGGAAHGARCWQSCARGSTAAGVAARPPARPPLPSPRRQVYLGGFECEDHAAEAYDIALLKCKGAKGKTNFELSK